MQSYGFNWLLKSDHLDEENFNSIIEFLTMNKWRAIIDLVYVFSAKTRSLFRKGVCALINKKNGKHNASRNFK